MAKANLFLKSAALLPLPFLALSPALGGSWAFAALFYLSIFAFLADESLIANSDVGHSHSKLAAVLADMVPVILGFSHLLLLPFTIFAISLSNLPFAEKVTIFMANALFFGIISTANAHELIHRPGWFRTSLGKWVFISLLFGHHVSAHLGIHHRYAATPLDPNTARMNEPFYRFFPRAWRGSFVAGLVLENERFAHTSHRRFNPSHPYAIYISGALVFLMLIWVLAGFAGLITYLAFAFFAQALLLLSDYVQHYGLARKLISAGKYEPVSIQHSWNAPHVFSTALMLNAPRHSDHHANPLVRYFDLRTRASEGAPVLPYSLPVMSTLALWPRIWRRLMNPRVADWVRQQDSEKQSSVHQEIAPTMEQKAV